MAKLILNDITSLRNEDSAINLINQNSASIETAMENTLSRDGTSPNSMSADLDMNSNSVLNLPQATLPTEPVRKQEFDAVIFNFDNIEVIMAEINAMVEQTEDYRDQTEVIRDETEVIKDEASGFADDAEGFAEDANISFINTSNLLATKADLVHTHSISQVTGLQQELDDIQAAATQPTVEYPSVADMIADTTQDDLTLSVVFGEPEVIATTTRARTSNVATVAFSSDHNFAVGSVVRIEGLPTDYNGTVTVISAPTTSSITYASTGSNEASTPDTDGFIYQQSVYRWNDGSGEWEWQTYAAIEGLRTRVTTLELETHDLTTGGFAGQIAQKATNADGDYQFISPGNIGENFSISVDITDSENYQPLTPTGLASPDAAFTLTVDGDELNVLNNRANSTIWTFALGRPDKTALGRSFRCKYRCESITKTLLSDNGLTGAGFFFSTTPPTPGAARASMDTNGGYIVFRDVGVWSEGGPVYPAAGPIVFTSQNNFAYYYNDGYTFETYLNVDKTDITKGELLVQVWDNLDNPLYNLRLTYEGMPGTAYISPGFFFGNNSDEFSIIEPFKITDPAPDVFKSIFVKPTAGADGNGSESSPYMSFSKAVAEDRSDPARGRLWLVLKDGIIRDTLPLLGNKWKEILITSVAGERPIIMGSVAIPSGSAAFTQPDAGTYPDVWAYNGGNSGWGLTEVTSGVTYACGRNGLVTVPYRQLSRTAAFNVTPATLTGNPGQLSGHFSGTYSGQLLFTTWDGSDPNTKDWELTKKANAISVLHGSSTDYDHAQITIDGVTFAHTSNENVRFQRCGKVLLYNCRAYAPWLGGNYQLDECDYEIVGCIGEGSPFDNLNNSGSISEAPTRDFVGRVVDSEMRGCTPNFNIGVGGDNISNHSRHALYVHNSKLLSPQKDCISASSGHIANGSGKVRGASVTDTYMSDAPSSGISQYCASGLTVEGSVKNSHIFGCVTGVSSLATAGTGGGNVNSFYIDNTLFENNTTDLVAIADSGKYVQIDVADWRIKGTSTGSTNTTSAIQVINKPTPRTVS